MANPKNQAAAVAPEQDLSEDESESPVREDTIRHIDNNTSHKIILPCTDTFPAGIHLICGLNSVPIDYLDELESLHKESAQIVTKSGRKTTSKERWPGREVLKTLQEPVRIVKASGETYGPQITIYADLQDRPDGPPAPMSLPQNKEAAMAIIRETVDAKALERWSKAGKGEIPQAARAKLENLPQARSYVRT